MRLFPCNLGIPTYPIAPVFSARRLTVQPVREETENSSKTTTLTIDSTDSATLSDLLSHGRMPCSIESFVHRVCVTY
jgi:hypothetical protein